MVFDKILAVMNDIQTKNGQYCTFEISSLLDGKRFQTYISHPECSTLQLDLDDHAPHVTHLKHDTIEEAHQRFVDYLANSNCEVIKHYEKERELASAKLEEINDHLIVLNEGHAPDSPDEEDGIWAFGYLQRCGKADAVPDEGSTSINNEELNLIHSRTKLKETCIHLAMKGAPVRLNNGSAKAALEFDAEKYTITTHQDIGAQATIFNWSKKDGKQS